MKTTNTNKLKGVKMTNVEIINGKEYKVEEIGRHSVKCKNQAMCLLPGTFKQVPATTQDGQATTRRIKIHIVPAHILKTPVN